MSTTYEPIKDNLDYSPLLNRVLKEPHFELTSSVARICKIKLFYTILEISKSSRPWRS